MIREELCARLHAHAGLVSRCISPEAGWRIPALPPYTSGLRLTGTHGFIMRELGTPTEDGADD